MLHFSVIKLIQMLNPVELSVAKLITENNEAVLMDTPLVRAQPGARIIRGNGLQVVTRHQSADQHVEVG